MFIVQPKSASKYCVPDLHFYLLVTHINNLSPELYADSRVMIQLEFLLDELQHETGLADVYVVDRVLESPITTYLKRKE